MDDFLLMGFTMDSSDLCSSVCLSSYKYDERLNADIVPVCFAGTEAQRQLGLSKCTELGYRIRNYNARQLIVAKQRNRALRNQSLALNSGAINA